MGPCTQRLASLVELQELPGGLWVREAWVGRGLHGPAGAVIPQTVSRVSAAAVTAPGLAWPPPRKKG